MSFVLVLRFLEKSLYSGFKKVATVINGGELAANFLAECCLPGYSIIAM
jgi:hypothetical protein